MKKIIFMILSVLLLVSCSKELRRALIGPQIEPVCDGWYRGHNTWGSNYVLTVSWRSVKSNEE